MWYTTLSEDDRQSVFAWMRQVVSEADRLLTQSRSLQAPHGSLAVGAAAFDPFVRGATIHEFLMALNKGSTPDEALEQAKAYGLLCVETHNAKRPRDINWQRWDHTADSHLDTLHRSLPIWRGPTMSKLAKAWKNALRPALARAWTAASEKLALGACVLQGDVLDRLPDLDDDSIDSIVTDPPYELGFMGKTWDSSGIAYNVEVWREALRVLKPGGHLLAFGGSRTYHRLACAIEDAGFEVRDQIMWLYGTGFPKSLNVSKAIDKTRKEDAEPVRRICRVIRAAMDAHGLKSRHLVKHFGGCDPRLIDHWAARDTDSQPSLPTWDQWQTLCRVLSMSDGHDAEVWRLNGRKGQPGDVWKDADIVGEYEGEPGGFGDHRFAVADNKIRESSAAAREWDGWGTALKPAHEPIVVARKSLIGTVAANVQAHGTGAINVDACRVEATDKAVFPAGIAGKPSTTVYGGSAGLFFDCVRPGDSNPEGRWPANVIHDGSDEVLAGFPNVGSRGNKGATQRKGGQYTVFGEYAGHTSDEDHWHKQEGQSESAARFFYCAKANKKEREAGLDSKPNPHPTVKPVALMRYLVRLVTRPGGLVLDPFTGSGTTGIACVAEGFEFVGIEREAEYVALAEARIAHAHADAHVVREDDE